MYMYLILYSATQLGILPTAEFEGKVLSGNATIARYLAEEHGRLNARLWW